MGKCNQCLKAREDQLKNKTLHPGYTRRSSTTVYSTKGWYVFSCFHSCIGYLKFKTHARLHNTEKSSLWNILWQKEQCHEWQ